MKQELEKSLYDARPVKKDLIIYNVGDLESLSSTLLYTGHLPPMGPGGFGNGNFGGGSGNGGPKIKQLPKGVSESIQRYGSGTIKAYVDLLNNEVSIREQLLGQPHNKQVKPLKIDKAY